MSLLQRPDAADRDRGWRSRKDEIAGARIEIPGVCCCEKEFVSPAFLNGEKPAQGEILAKCFARSMDGAENEQFRSRLQPGSWVWLLSVLVISSRDSI